MCVFKCLTVDSESRGGREPVGLLTLFGQLLVSKLGMKTMIDLEIVKFLNLI